MTANSILFKSAGSPEEIPPGAASDFLSDLNLNRLLEELKLGRNDDTFDFYFRAPLSNAESIRFRQAVVKDFEKPDVADAVRKFTTGLSESRRRLALSNSARVRENADGWHLDAALSYAAAVSSLAERLAACDLESEGMSKWRSWLSEHVAGGEFADLARTAENVKRGLSAIEYTIRIKGDTCVVGRRGSGTVNLETDILRTFEKFQGATLKRIPLTVNSGGDGMNSVKERVLECVARLFPKEFEALREFRGRHPAFINDDIADFACEAGFLLAYLGHIAPLADRGLRFCHPEISDSKNIDIEGMFDLALARELASRGGTPVANDFRAAENERIFVESGPNQGGKTTFARALGQTLYLAKLGLPVPARRATVFLCDHVLTHFEREEKIENLQGRLQDDLLRTRDLLNLATSNSLVILNETFNSTTLEDGVFLGGEILRRIAVKGSLCLFVTFLDELASPSGSDELLAGKVVSLMALTNPENPAERTFKVARKPADGQAYAKILAEAYRLTRKAIKERVKR